MASTRRGLLAAAGGLLAGCAAPAARGGDTGDGVGWEPITIRNETVTIQPGGFEAYPVASGRRFRLQYETFVREGPAVDALVLDREERAAFAAGRQFAYRRRPSEPDSANAIVIVTLPAGAYELVLDHSARGPTAPPADAGPSTVEVHVGAYL